jgi:hypothetical protein
MKTSWTIDPALLLEDEDFSLAALIAAATSAETEFMAKASIAAAPRSSCQPRRLRAKDFPFQAEPRVMRELHKLGYCAWLLRVKGETGTDATVRFAAEFVAFCSKAQKLFAGFVNYCVIQCLSCPGV